VRDDSRPPGRDPFVANGKSPRAAGFFFFHSIPSVWQDQADLLPDFPDNFGVEVLLYQELLL
jgi:hypothetical protein